MHTDEIVEIALELKPDERLDVVDEILSSRDHPDPEIDRIWIDEAEKRLAAYRAGKVKGVPAEEIFGTL